MFDFDSPAVSPAWILRGLFRYPFRWLLPTVLVASAAGAYARFRPDTWQASQPVMVRNEAVANWEGPGKFRQEDEMKLFQETILELARGRTVLRSAAQAVGPPDDFNGGEWPDELAIEGAREALSLAPPQGAEFGSTEIFYLRFKDQDPARAERFVAEIYAALRQEVGRLRSARAGAMRIELEDRVRLAQEALESSTELLATLERKVGDDLSELRMLHQSPAGDGDSNRTLVNARSELLKTRESLAIQEELARVLKAAQTNPDSLLSAPGALVETQPTLKRLKDGLADARLKTSVLLGALTEDHPQAQAARRAEQTIHETMVEQIQVALASVESDQRLTGERIKSLENSIAESSARLARLADVRASYSNLATEVDERRGRLARAEQSLADVTASQGAAASASLMSAVDDPRVGARPMGPGRKTIAAIGVLGGLVLGLGLWFLTIPAPGGTPSPRDGLWTGSSGESIGLTEAKSGTKPANPTKVTRQPALVKQGPS